MLLSMRVTLNHFVLGGGVPPWRQVSKVGSVAAGDVAHAILGERQHVAQLLAPPGLIRRQDIAQQSLGRDLCFSPNSLHTRDICAPRGLLVAESTPTCEAGQ